MLKRVAPWLGTIALIASAFAAPGSAWAEGGELYSVVSLSGERASLDYIRGGLVAGPGYSAHAGWQTRTEIGLFYGLTDDWLLGVDFGYSWEDVAKFENSIIQERQGNLFTKYRDFSIPLTLSYLFSRGYSSSLLVTAMFGPAHIKMSDSVFLDPERLDSNGNPGAVTIDAKRASSWGLVAGARVEWNWRPTSWFVLNLGPYATFRHADIGDGFTSMHIGVALRPGLVWAAGPSF